MAAVIFGHPLVYLVALSVGHDQVCTRHFLAVGNVGLLDFNVYGLVVHYQDGVAIFIRTGRAAARHSAVLVDAEDCIAGDGISVGSQRLTQRVFLARLQAFDFVRLVAGHPFLHDVFILVQDLQRRAGQFFITLGDVALAYGNMGFVVFNNQHFNAVFTLAVCAVACDVTLCINAEGRYARDGVAIRSNGLNQLVCHAGLQTFHIIRFVSGDPGLDDLVFRIQDLHGRTRQFLLIGDIDLADLHLGDAVFNQDHSAFGHRTGSSDLAGFVDHEGGLSGDRVAQRRHGLLQGIGLAGMQALHFMDFLRGGPLFNDLAVLVDDLDMCAFQLFTVGNIHLADLHFSQRIFDQDHSAFGDAAGGGYLTGFVDLEGGLSSDRVAQRRHGLLQGIGLAGMQAVYFVDILCGCPLFNDGAVLVDDLDMCAFQLFTVCYVNLADFHIGDAVGDGISPVIAGNLGDDRSFIAGNLCFSYGVLDLSIVIQFDQVSPGMLPTVLFVQFNRFAKVVAVCFQLNLNALGPDTALIVIVIPDLFNGYFCCLQRVRDAGAAYDLIEARNRFFIHTVNNFCRAVRTVLRQFLGGEAPLAVIAGLHGQCLNNVVAVLDIDCNLFRQQLRIVALQIPDLFAADCCQFRNVCVLNVVSGHNLTEAFRHFFIHCISDFGCAVCFVLRQISGCEGPLVVLAGGYGQRVYSIAALLDVDRDAFGHKGFIITLHIPGLFTADFGSLQRILHCIGEASIRSLRDHGCIVRNRVFCDRVVNIAAAGLLLQVLPAIGPVVVSIQLSRFNLRAVSQQVDSHTVRTAAVLVVAVLPDLRHIDLGLFSCVLIGNCIGKGSVSCLGNRRGVVRHRVFCHGIVDICTAGLLLKVRPGICPLVLSIQFDRLAGFCAVCKQLDRDFLRPVVVLVVSIVPDLRYLDPGLFSCVLIGNCIGKGSVFCLGNCRGVVRHCVFCYSVFDFCSVGILVQTGPAVSPAVGRIQINGFNLFTVGQQVDSDLGRTIAILVIAVLPNLRNTDFSFFCCMRIGQGIAEVAGTVLREVNGLLVSFRYRDFIDSVIDQFTLLVLVELSPLMAPAVALIECHRSTNVLTVSLQLHVQTIGTDAVLIALVFPDLQDRDINLIRLMAVLDGVAVVAGIILRKRDGLRVSFRYNDFIHSVLDQLTVLELVQPGPLKAPSVRLIERYGSTYVHAAGLQLHADAFRLQAILVFTVVPDLFYRNLDLFGFMGVGNSIGVVALAVLDKFNLLLITGRNVRFIHAVVDQRAVIVLIQTGPVMFPAIGLIQCYKLADVNIILFELYGNAAGALAVLVVLVIPDLFNRHFDLFGLMTVADGIAVVARLIFFECDVLCIAAGYSGFIHAVYDGLAILVLFKSGPFIVPVVAGIQRYGCTHVHAVSFQLYAYAGRTDTILVALVEPLLVNRYVNLIGRMGIGQGSDGAVLRVSAEGVSARQVCFIPCVVDQLAVVILRQVINGRCPVVRRGQRNSIHLGCTVHQVNGQAFRTDAVLVVRVGPFLGHGNGGFFLCIGNDHLTRAITVIGITCSTDCGSFYYIIGKVIDCSVCIIQVLRQILPLVLPVVGLAQRLGINNRVFLAAGDFRNRLQSILHRTYSIDWSEADVAHTIGSNGTPRGHFGIIVVILKNDLGCAVAAGEVTGVSMSIAYL